MLRDRYYIGYVRFSGNEYQGRHPHLIPLDLFHKVQEIMGAQSGAGIRQRKRNHYLKGTLWCGRCGRRMVASVAKGIYEYYMCRGRQTRDCDLPYLPIDKIEQAVTDHYVTVSFPEEIQTAVRAQFDMDLTGQSRHQHATTRHAQPAPRGAVGERRPLPRPCGRPGVAH